VGGNLGPWSWDWKTCSGERRERHLSARELSTVTQSQVSSARLEYELLLWFMNTNEAPLHCWRLVLKAGSTLYHSNFHHSKLVPSYPLAAVSPLRPLPLSLSLWRWSPRSVVVAIINFIIAIPPTSCRLHHHQHHHHHHHHHGNTIQIWASESARPNCLPFRLAFLWALPEANLFAQNSIQSWTIKR